MADEELKKLLLQNIELSEKIYRELEKQRKLRRLSLIIGLIVIVLPIIIAIIAFPWMMKTVQGYYGGMLNL